MVCVDFVGGGCMRLGSFYGFEKILSFNEPSTGKGTL